MQPPRKNKDRSASTRAALIDAARHQFVERGYAETSTPDLAKAAGVTRGALYHHFADKQALFLAVVEAEAAAVAEEIDRAPGTTSSHIEALLAGGDAYLRAMQVPGRTRLLLIEAPAVLGRMTVKAIDDAQAARQLSEGLAAAIDSGAIHPLPLSALTELLSSAFDRAALAVESGAAIEDWRQVFRKVIVGLAV
jgi:AcrR family transcriptional regulator